MLRTLGRLCLVFALLCAWQGALEHPLEHFASALRAGVDSGGVDRDHPLDLAHPCDVCVATAGAAAHGSAAQRLATPASVRAVPPTAGALPRPAHLAYRSRAPPSFS